eukprot:5676168-Prymnesium_polylepis.3
MVTNWGALLPSRKWCYTMSSAIRARRMMPSVRAELLQPWVGRVGRVELAPWRDMQVLTNLTRFCTNRSQHEPVRTTPSRSQVVCTRFFRVNVHEKVRDRTL